jgi:hypothetical protein
MWTLHQRRVRARRSRVAVVTIPINDGRTFANGAIISPPAPVVQAPLGATPSPTGAAVEISQRAALIALFDAAREVGRVAPWATTVTLYARDVPGAADALKAWASTHELVARDQYIAARFAAPESPYMNLTCGPVTILHYREATSDEQIYADLVFGDRP